MPTNRNQPEPRRNEAEEKDNAANRNRDLQDSPRDQEKLRSEETTIDMPEVKDIPGQENVRAPRVREMEDTTISSDDEEGAGLLDNLNGEEPDDNFIKMGTEADVTNADVEMLESGDTYYPSHDEDHLVQASMQNVDDEGEPLNEKGFGISMRTGEDLDLPGKGDDDTMEESGAEDEENNEYSLGGENNDQLEEDRNP